MERKWLKSGLESDRMKYRNQRQLVQSCVRTAKTSYNSKLVESCTNTRQLFRVANALLNRNKQPPLPTCVNIADRFNNFFIEKVQIVRSTLPHIGGFEVPIITKTTLDTLSPTTPKEIETIIRSSPSKSSELDPIPTSLLKQCLPAIAPSIVNIINTSLCSGIVPDSMKVASVRPTLKKI